MTDRYQTFTRTPLGQTLVKNLGLPDPTPLPRWRAGDRVIDGPVVFGAIGETDAGKAIQALLRDVGAAFSTATEGVASSSIRPKALVFDATGASTTADLTSLQRFFSPVIRQLAAAGRVIVVGRTPELAQSAEQQVAQRALEGFTRSLGKEVKRGATVNLVYVAPDAHDQLDSTLRFFLSPKSAYVSGQVTRVGTGQLVSNDPAQPLAGQVALVTGAARGIGASIAEVLVRDGATVIGVDVAQNAEPLHKVMTRLGGTELLLDVTAVDAAQRIAAHAQEHHGGIDIVVHNAGITRDKRLANMRTDTWDAVLDVNLRAPEHITAHLVETGALRDGGSIIGVSSIAGIAGNNGQTNYATSKAGVIGLVQALAPKLAEKQVRINAVAPGFIETEMTAKVPFAIREVGRRINSMQQGGQPVDVAETIAWLADPASAGVTGNVVRVCGQSMLGA
ncbi:3-oxoacyl-ACP reductase [Kribbella sandramycini]|uniref:3-oxoacyl-ACP reductase n=1 Tax=Kribbella sandramycini TaxID=60450 RepID=A0A7Y4NZC3_9ACTN|nr:3-oxoacyl-ACP reductase [Kribbella sandramycini]MBB6569468.1 3-oxoacyl-[acyl-carrier protein] reductase [Kribbella sandramycini]NOL40698.1 3-oxoacyl-ACP reductase [Kribbella sandramycini]